MTGSEPWTINELSEAIGRIEGQQLVSGGKSVCFCFFIDGLDEFNGDHKQLLPLLKGLVDVQSIKICASSRPWNPFENAFGGDSRKLLVLQDLTRQDISIYTRSQLEKSPRLLEIQRECNDGHDIVSEITGKASGMFLWVYLVIRGLSDSLENGDGIEELRDRVRRLPSDLDKYFRYMFKHYDEFYEKQVAQIFLVCLESSEPPPLIEFSAFGPLGSPSPGPVGEFETSKQVEEATLPRLAKQLNGRCTDLLEVSYDEGDAFQRPALTCVVFTHRSVRDFLMAEDISTLIKERAGCGFDPVEMLHNIYYTTLQQLAVVKWDKTQEEPNYAYAYSRHNELRENKYFCLRNLLALQPDEFLEADFVESTLLPFYNGDFLSNTMVPLLLRRGCGPNTQDRLESVWAVFLDGLTHVDQKEGLLDSYFEAAEEFILASAKMHDFIDGRMAKLGWIRPQAIFTDRLRPH